MHLSTATRRDENERASVIINKTTSKQAVGECMRLRPPKTALEFRFSSHDSLSLKLPYRTRRAQTGLYFYFVRCLRDASMQAVKVKYKDRQKYICYKGYLNFASFLQCVARKFDMPMSDVKVYDESKTEVDEGAFEFLLNKQDLGVLEICSSNEDEGVSSLASYSGDSEEDSDDTIILQHSTTSMKRFEDFSLSRMIESILKKKPGGDRVLSEYARTKSLTDGRRRDMVNILVAHMTSEHGTRPSRWVKEEYAKGIITLFPNLANPNSKLGYEHYYSAKGGETGFLAWTLKYFQRKTLDRQKRKSRAPLPKGDPKADQDPIQYKNYSMMTENQCCEAIALMKHTTDEKVIKDKMKQTFHYRQSMVHDSKKSTNIFMVFPRFLDITGLIEQDFRLMFGDATSAKFLEKWPKDYKQKVLKQSRCLPQTRWDGDISSILLLIHLLPPPHGHKRPGLSARQACDHLVKFLQTGTSIQDHLDSVKESHQPYLLACGNTKRVIHNYFIVIDKHAMPWKIVETGITVPRENGPNQEHCARKWSKLGSMCPGKVAQTEVTVPDKMVQTEVTVSRQMVQTEVTVSRQDGPNGGKSCEEITSTPLSLEILELQNMRGRAQGMCPGKNCHAGITATTQLQEILELQRHEGASSEFVPRKGLPCWDQSNIRLPGSSEAPG
ncbi:hypothetical protein WMY93_021709 [Mugilogobius chulae]|uniref:PB1 domain-containing protein n=1 Tax=Mugilogobius chulae TaxID=88201 RepID=A0AAW0NG35_9GOBI